MKALSIDFSGTFFTPVVCNGLGTLQIGTKNNFGAAPAFRICCGEIMVQPRFEHSMITIGNNNWFSNNLAMIAAKSIVVGNDCRIGDLVMIVDCDFHEINPLTRNNSYGKSAEIIIGNNVWIGSRAIILKGVTIGDNSVVAAMSVVTKSVPSNCIVAGNPATVVRNIRLHQYD